SDFPMAVGAALSCRMQGLDRVSCVYFGEGTAGQADFHPAMHMAMLWNLPVIFACVNNQYVELHHYREITHLDDVLDLARGYRMNAVMVPDGNDVAAVYEAVSGAVARARAGGGPTMLELKSYRIASHFTGDSGAYMPADEVAAWRRKDPIPRCRAEILAGGLDPAALARLEAAVDREVAEAMVFVLASPFPAAEGAFDDVFATGEVAR
ncbi:MAG: thiamine pyrophosphate-dependent dehydrogenase E1 component subunit alpha, partial [Deferrisomatales bacterium]